MVSDEGFIDLANVFIEIGANYGKIDASTLIKHPSNIKRTNLVNIYQKYKDAFIDVLQTCKHFSFTSDLWKDKYKGNFYLSLTVQFINSSGTLSNVCLYTILCKEKKKDDIRSYLLKGLHDFFGNSDEILKDSYFITDNGSNVKNIFNKWLPCACHNINLTLSHTFKEESLTQFPAINELILTSKKLVDYFKKSGRNLLLKKTLKQEISTRWNSTLLMLESIYENWADISTVLFNLNKSSKMIGINKKLLELIISILTPFKIASEELSSSKNVTINKVVIWKFKLIQVLKTIIDNEHHLEIINFSKRIMDCLNEKYVLYDEHYFAAFLDPRYY